MSVPSKIYHHIHEPWLSQVKQHEADICKVKDEYKKEMEMGYKELQKACNDTKSYISLQGNSHYDDTLLGLLQFIMVKDIHSLDKLFSYFPESNEGTTALLTKPRIFEALWKIIFLLKLDNLPSLYSYKVREFYTSLQRHTKETVSDYLSHKINDGNASGSADLVFSVGDKKADPLRSPCEPKYVALSKQPQHHIVVTSKYYKSEKGIDQYDIEKLVLECNKKYGYTEEAPRFASSKLSLPTLIKVPGVDIDSVMKWWDSKSVNPIAKNLTTRFGTDASILRPKIASLSPVLPKIKRTRPNFSIMVWVKDKHAFLRKLYKGRAKSEITQYIKEEFVLDVSDLNRAFIRLCDYLKQCEQPITMDTIMVRFKSDTFKTIKLLDLRFHQEYMVRYTQKQFDLGIRKIMWGAVPRSGKSYMVGGLISRNKPKIVLLILGAISETKDQFIKELFEMYHDFKDYEIIDIQNKTDTERINEIDYVKQFGRPCIIVCSQEQLRTEIDTYIHGETYWQEYHHPSSHRLSELTTVEQKLDTIEPFFAVSAPIPLEHQTLYDQSLQNGADLFADAIEGNSAVAAVAAGSYVDEVPTFMSTQTKQKHLTKDMLQAELLRQNIPFKKSDNVPTLCKKLGYEYKDKKCYRPTYSSAQTQFNEDLDGDQKHEQTTSSFVSSSGGRSVYVIKEQLQDKLNRLVYKKHILEKERLPKVDEDSKDELPPPTVEEKVLEKEILAIDRQLRSLDLDQSFNRKPIASSSHTAQRSRMEPLEDKDTPYRTEPKRTSGFMEAMEELLDQEPMIFFDEVHQGGGSIDVENMQEQLLNHFYYNEKTKKRRWDPYVCFVTATYVKPTLKYGNPLPKIDNRNGPELKVVTWSYENNNIRMKKLDTIDDVSILVDDHDPEKISVLEHLLTEWEEKGISRQTIAESYESYPELQVFIPKKLDGLATSTINGDLDVDKLFRLTRGGGLKHFSYVQDSLTWIYENVYNPLYGKDYGTTADGTGSFHSQLWFLPTHITYDKDEEKKSKDESEQSPFEELSRCLAAEIVKHKFFQKFNVAVVHSLNPITGWVKNGDFVQDGTKRVFLCNDHNVKDQLKKVEIQTQSEGKSLIILTGKRLRLGVSLTCTDIALHMDPIENVDTIYQSMFRVLTEREGKTKGIFVDLLPHRAISFMYQIGEYTGKKTVSRDDVIQTLFLFNVNRARQLILDPHRSGLDQYESLLSRFHVNTDVNFYTYHEQLYKERLGDMENEFTKELLLDIRADEDLKRVVNQFIVHSNKPSRKGKKEVIKDADPSQSSSAAAGAPKPVPDIVKQLSDKDKLIQVFTKIKTILGLFCLLSVRQVSLDDLCKSYYSRTCTVEEVEQLPLDNLYESYLRTYAEEEVKQLSLDNLYESYLRTYTKEEVKQCETKAIQACYHHQLLHSNTPVLMETLHVTMRNYYDLFIEIEKRMSREWLQTLFNNIQRYLSVEQLHTNLVKERQFDWHNNIDLADMMHVVRVHDMIPRPPSLHSSMDLEEEKALDTMEPFYAVAAPIPLEHQRLYDQSLQNGAYLFADAIEGNAAVAAVAAVDSVESDSKHGGTRKYSKRIHKKESRRVKRKKIRSNKYKRISNKRVIRKTKPYKE